MLEVIRGHKGEIQACLEWWLVDVYGNFDPQGMFVWLNQLEIAESSNGSSVGYIKEFIKRICKKAPMAKFGYFDREKYHKRLRMFTRNKWLKFARGGKDVSDNR